MRIPKTPPNSVLWKIENHARLLAIMQSAPGPLVNGKYMHWEKVRFHYPPNGVSNVEWWMGLKFRRQSMYKKLPLFDKSGEEFVYALVDPIPQLLHKIDLGAGGLIQMSDPITNQETKDQYYVSSLIDEAITSSQLEGATTTRPIAREMIRTGRPPRDKSERMILNNYHAMKAIGKLKEQPLSKELVFEIHRLVTDKTLDDQSAAGRFRRDDEQVRVEGNYGEIYHDPPCASSLDIRMEQMCEFANEDGDDSDFIYPVLRSIILHFWLSYDHPFVDGNGRTARALFYWSMLRHKYWLCEFISISQIIRKAPVKYGKAFLYTETDDNDLTYFILYHLQVIHRAIDELHAYIARKTQEITAIEKELRGMDNLNHRQRALVSHALRHPYQRYTVESHRTSHNIVYETARTDLLDLTQRGLLTSTKIGKAYSFSPRHDLAEKLRNMT
jgi:Fic family protein